MHRNRTIYIFLVLAFLAFSIAYQSRIASVLLIASLCYPVLALACVLLGSRLTEVGFVDSPDRERDSSNDRPRIVRQKGEEFDLWIYVRSRSILPYAPVELQCTLPDRDMGLFSAKRIYASVPPFGKCRISVSSMHHYRGAYIAEISRACFYDPLRMIRVTRKLGREATLIFLPRKRELEELVSGASSEDSVSPLPFTNGEKEEFSHVREYILGDIMQYVHWKLTAKLDDLMIKQYDETAEERALVLCDYGFGAADQGSAMRQADAVIEAAISVVMSTARAGISSLVDFGTLNGDYRSQIKDMSEFDRFYDMMSVIPSRLETMEFRQLIAENLRGCLASGGCSVVFLITGRLSEDIASAAEAAAESFRGTLVLADVDPGRDPALEAQMEEKKFVYLPLKKYRES